MFQGKARKKKIFQNEKCKIAQAQLKLDTFIIKLLLLEVEFSISKYSILTQFEFQR
jgi:hypothetical protein